MKATLAILLVIEIMTSGYSFHVVRRATICGSQPVLCHSGRARCTPGSSDCGSHGACCLATEPESTAQRCCIPNSPIAVPATPSPAETTGKTPVGNSTAPVPVVPPVENNGTTATIPHTTSVTETPEMNGTHAANVTKANNITGSTIATEVNTTGATMPPGVNVTGSVISSGENVTGSTISSGENVTGSTISSGENVTGSTISSGENVTGSIISSGENVTGSTISSGENVTTGYTSPPGENTTGLTLATESNPTEVTFTTEVNSTRVSHATAGTNIEEVADFTAASNGPVNSTATEATKTLAQNGTGIGDNSTVASTTNIPPSTHATSDKSNVLKTTALIE